MMTRIYGGDVMRSFLDLFSLSKNQKQTARTEVGEEFLHGLRGERNGTSYYTTIIAGSRVETRHHVVHGSNYVLRVKANEYWSRTNNKKIYIQAHQDHQLEHQPNKEKKIASEGINHGN